MSSAVRTTKLDPREAAKVGSAPWESFAKRTTVVAPSPTKLNVNEILAIPIDPTDFNPCQPGKPYPGIASDPEPKKEAPLDPESEIISLISEINQAGDRAIRTIRRGLIRIESLGGYRSLGYATDKEFLLKEFPQFNHHYLRHNRTAGRLEKIISAPIGAYTIPEMYPLFQFRILVPQGGTTNREGRTNLKPNQKGIASVKEAWGIACQLSGGDRPQRTHIEQAVIQMAEAGRAKPLKVRRDKNSPSKLKERIAELETENQGLREECDRLSKQLRGNYERGRDLAIA
jgi:hypothetical protein